MQELVNTHQSKKLYMVEFLRIFFLFFIILGHIMGILPTIKSSIFHFFSTNEMNDWLGVELFFIIGGFFLYERMKKSDDAWLLIKKTYVRLLPTLMFVFLLLVCFRLVNIQNAPIILTLTTGLTIPGEVTGWGDWYVGAYFGASALFVGLFVLNRKQAFLWTFIFMYITLCLKFNAPYEGWMKTYYTIIGNQFVRAIYSMGLGITAAFISDNVFVKNNVSTKYIFTAIEIICLISVFGYIVYPKIYTFNLWEMEIVFAILMILIKSSYGYISTILNRYNKIQYVSRYTYSIFLGHIIPIRLLLSSPNKFGFSESNCALLIFGGAIVIGITEYLLIEQKLVPYLKKIF